MQPPSLLAGLTPADTVAQIPSLGGGRRGGGSLWQHGAGESKGAAVSGGVARRWCATGVPLVYQRCDGRPLGDCPSACYSCCVHVLVLVLVLALMLMLMLVLVLMLPLLVQMLLVPMLLVLVLMPVLLVLPSCWCCWCCCVPFGQRREQDSREAEVGVCPRGRAASSSVQNAEAQPLHLKPIPSPRRQGRTVTGPSSSDGTGGSRERQRQ